MLVLTRKSDEAIIITMGKYNIVIKTLEVRGGKVSIGIEAPKDCSIVRAELLTDNRSKEVKSDLETVEISENELELIGASNT